MVARLEAEEPFWEPGTRNGYHMINFGWTVGELVRRVSGPSLGTFFRRGDRRAARHRLLDRAARGARAPRRPGHRRTPRQKGEPLSEFELAVVSDRASVPSLALANIGGDEPRTAATHHAAEIGGGGGITNGRGLAGMYTPLALGGGVARRPRRPRPHASRCRAATNRDATLRIATRFAMGFMV